MPSPQFIQQALRALRFACFSAVALVTFGAAASPGRLDVTFGGGVQKPAFGFGTETFLGAQLDANGRLLLLSRSYGTDPNTIEIVRLAANGSGDATFGKGGKLTARYPELAFTGYAGSPGFAATLADGRILVASAAQRTQFIGGLAVLRLLPDGSRDPTYGFDGGFFLFTEPFGTTGGYSLAADADGGVFIADGYKVRRFTPNGVLDTQYGNAGTVTLGQSTGGYVMGLDTRVLANGRLLAIASIQDSGGYLFRATLLKPDGTPDASYGSGGTYTSAQPFTSASGRMIVTAAGQIYIFWPDQASLGLYAYRITATGVLDATYGQGVPSSTPITRISYETFVGARLNGDGTVRLASRSPLSPSEFYERALDAQGQLDLAFGVQGTQTTVAPANCPAGATIDGGAGRWLVVGAADFGVIPFYSQDLFACRFVSGFQPDPAWGTNGRVQLNVGDSNKEGFAAGLVAFPDGSVLATGTAGRDDYEFQVALAKFRPDGSPDPAFGTDGKVSDPIGTSSLSIAMVPMADGKFVVAGSSNGFSSSLLVARFNANGSLDTTFASTGKFIYAPEPTNNATALAVYPDGRVLVAGTNGYLDDYFGQSYLLRLLADGTPDPAFGVNGRLVPPTGPSAVIRSLVLLADERILMSGTTNGNAFVARLTSTGSSDNTFVGTGPGIYAVPTTSAAIAYRIAVQADGRILIASMPVSDQPYLRRLLADGALDTSFGTGGTTTISPGTYGPIAWHYHALLPMPDGRILVAGDGAAFGGFKFVARLLGNGALDTTFAPFAAAPLDPPNLFVMRPASGAPSGATDGFKATTALALAPGGRIMLGGSEATRFAVRRITGDANTSDLDNDGIPDDVEPDVSRNPLVKDNDIFAAGTSGARLFAMQQYRDFLGREGDVNGIQFYVDLLSAGALSRADVIENFFNSPEFSGLASPVARLYFATFLRTPDYAGLLFQIDQLRIGLSLAQVATNFTASPEFQATYGALDNPAFVSLLYNNILGRAASQPEIDYHVARLAGGASRGDVLVGFSESPEYRAAIGNEVYVTMMYVGMLRRAPESGGLTYWVNYMDAGNAGGALIQGVLNAPEYRQRFLP